MPDIFIPVDTSKFTSWHRNVVAKGVLNKLNLNYIDRHREEIKTQYSTFEEYKDRFEVPESLMQELQERASADSILFREEEYLRSKELIKLQFKALIARDIYEKNECYTRIMNEENESFNKALMILREPKEYEKILKGI